MISTKSDATVYTTGEAPITIYCTLFFGASGSGPPDANVQWEGIPNSVTPMIEDLGTNEADGTRTMSLTLAGNEAKFDAVYTCSFGYSQAEVYAANIQFVTRCEFLSVLHVCAAFAMKSYFHEMALHVCCALRETARALKTFHPSVITKTPSDATMYTHTNADFKITCQFEGTETPTSVVWKKDGTGLTHDVEGYTLVYTTSNKEAVLTKNTPR